MRIVITGADGFVGRVLVKRLLLEPDVEIVTVSRRPQTKMPRTVPILADLSQPNWSKELPESADVVLALAQSQRYSEFPEGANDMARINIASVTELLDWSRHAGIKKFVLASTGNVYRPSSAPLTEEDPCEPNSFYASTKLSAEYITRSYGAIFQVVIARLFGVYGPDQPRGLFRNLQNAIVEKRQVTLGGGTGLHLTPIFVEDCAEALARLSLLSFSGAEKIANVSSDEVMDVRTIAATMGQMLGMPPIFVETKERPASLIADVGRLHGLLKWKPSVMLHDGLARMLQPGPR